jgi:hypothetical protein
MFHLTSYLHTGRDYDVEILTWPVWLFVWGQEFQTVSLFGVVIASTPRRTICYLKQLSRMSDDA